MARKRRRSKLVPVAEVLPRVYPDPQGLVAAKVFGAFTSTMPARLVANARPVRFDRGTLYVNVATPAWANELTLLAPTMLARIRERLPTIPVQRLRFRTGPLPDVELRPPEVIEHVAPVPHARLSPELAGAVARIHDDGLRDGVLRAAATSIARAEARAAEKPKTRPRGVLET